MNKEQKQALLDTFGKTLISEVRDRALKISMGIVMQTTANTLDLERYKVFLRQHRTKPPIKSRKSI